MTDTPNPTSGSQARSGASAAGAATTAREEASQTMEEARQEGQKVLGTAKEEARKYADEQKRAGADKVAGVARAVNNAAGELESSAPEFAGIARSAASGIESFSDRMRDSSYRDLVSGIEDFARREPVAFFGSAMFAGFALSRFMKSTSRPRGGDSHSRPGASTSSGQTLQGRQQ